MMGVLPMVFKAGDSWQSLGLTGHESFDIVGLDDTIQPKQELTVRATDTDGKVTTFTAIARLDTPIDVEYYRNGGILQTVLRGFIKQ